VPVVPQADAAWHVYVLTDEARRAFSISIARDVIARCYRHRQLVDTADMPRRPTPRLVLVEAYACRHTAFARMRRMRLWNIRELRAMIETTNPDWDDLYRDPFEQSA
jgi:predicted GIY-YIG superfamily endonuclease